MATIKQINANRKNALLSKGPKSDLGKLKSSKNSLKHGLTSKQLVIGESYKEFEKYRDRMIDELKPEGILEEETVFKIIDTGFRLRRIGEVEAGVYNQEILHHEADEYKNKIERGPQSALMYAQAAALSDSDIKELSKYIVSL